LRTSTSKFERRSRWDKPRYFAHAPGLQKHPVYRKKSRQVTKQILSASHNEDWLDADSFKFLQDHQHECEHHVQNFNKKDDITQYILCPSEDPTNCLSMTEEYDLSTYNHHKLNYNQIVLGHLAMSVIYDYTIWTIVYSPQS
jgi:hypothetical protein